jgi:hypothetical protein
MVFAMTGTAQLGAQDNNVPGILPDQQGKVGIGTNPALFPDQALHILARNFSSPIDQAFIRFGFIDGEIVGNEDYVGHIGIFSPLSGIPLYTQMDMMYINPGDMIIHASETAEDIILTTRNDQGNIRFATTSPGSSVDKQRMVINPEGNVGINTNNVKGLFEMNFANWGNITNGSMSEAPFPRILFSSNSKIPANSSLPGFESPSLWFIQATGTIEDFNQPISYPGNRHRIYAFQIDTRTNNGYNDYGVLNINTNRSPMLYDIEQEPDISELTTTYSFTRDGKMSINHDNPEANLHVLGNARFNDPTTNEDMTGTHSDYRVLVEGKLVAKEIIVTLSDWADHVFDPNRPLQDLASLEQDIQKLGHLPGVPSEQEVLENGVNMGDMQVIMLEKIEELTLHMIQLKKENDKLKSEIKAIKGTK